MNRYPKHIGDWRTATWNLTKVQRCIYADLIDTYYDREGPLTSDFDMLAEEHACRSEEERAALRYILQRYFKLDGTCYHHERCDEEISHAHHLIEVASKAGRASVSARSQRKMNGGSGGPAPVAPAPPVTPAERPLNAESTQRQPPITHNPPSLADAKGEGAKDAPPPAPAPEKVHRPAKKAPKDFEVSASMRAWAATECPLLADRDVELETKKFKDHTFARPISDWEGAWRNWLRKEQQFRESKPASRGVVVNGREAERNRVAAGLFGNKENSNAAGGHGAIDVESRVVRDGEGFPPDADS